VRFERRFVPVDFVEIIDVLVLPVLQHVEAHAARLIALGPQGIRLDRRQKTLVRFGLHPDFDPNRQHRIPLLLEPALAGRI
jgi:hypothetical protein